MVAGQGFVQVVAPGRLAVDEPSLLDAGTVAELRAEPPGARLIIREAKIAAETAVAESISVKAQTL